MAADETKQKGTAQEQSAPEQVPSHTYGVS